MADLSNHYISTLKTWFSQEKRIIHVVGLSGSALSYFSAMLLNNLQRPCMVLLPTNKEAEDFRRELQFFCSETEDQNTYGEGRLHLYPSYDISPLSGISPHGEIVTQRVGSLYALTSLDEPVVISSIEALIFRALPKKVFLQSLEYLEAEEEFDRDQLLSKLQAMGYQRTSLVEERGDYAVRGGVIDLYSPLYSFPLRLEFWGDRLESIRQFDPLTQRSQDHLKGVVILPASEIVMDDTTLKRARSMGRLPKQGGEGTGFPGQEAWLKHFYDSLDTLFDYLPERGLVVLMDPHRFDSTYRRLEGKFRREAEGFREDAALRGNPFPEIEGIVVSQPDLNEHLERHPRVEFRQLSLDEEHLKGNVLPIKGSLQLDEDLEVRLAAKGRVSLAPLAEKISGWLALRGKVVLVSRTEQQAYRLREILENYQVPTDRLVQGWADLPTDPGLYVCLGRLSKGFIWPELGIYVVSEDEIFGEKRAQSRAKRRPDEGGLTWSSFSELKEGDLVVHEDHGIGRYLGLSKMEIQVTVNEFVMIEYANNDRLYIPADRVSILQKYMGADEKDPKLDQLGGRSWNLTKKKAKRSIREIAKQLLQLYALRKYRQGYGFSVPDNYFKEFEATFQYEETSDQIRAIEDVIEDMTADRPMDRLICGDVGFGKTEVAIRAAFKCVSDGKQVALLVPTTVLAEQHYETFKTRMAPYNIRIGILSRFKTRKEQSEVLKELRSGRIQILIGTHRILQKDVSFMELGLLIIDEEQRFGVNQKEGIKKFRALVDVLALTATPIPRTLQMSMMGVRDLSIIETPPEDRLAIETHLLPYDEGTIVRAIEFELERGGQVFFVHNRVQTIKFMAESLRQMVPGARFDIAHGQMKEKELEDTMVRFLHREIDVLVCTTIIESGLDIPSANTIIINEVERFGLAQIYQLRGRVGRANEKAYAYLLLSDPLGMTRDAEKRLKALMDFTHLGAGIHIALHDLRIRGGGNILGFVQSGHISSIGYELYLRMIEQAVAELKGEEWKEDINPEIHVDIPAFLPGEYVADTDIRLNLYRRLSSLREEPQLGILSEEIRDRFGPPPQEVENLLDLVSVRMLLKRMDISRLDVGKSGFTLTFSPQNGCDPDALVRLVTREPRRFHFLPHNRLRVNTGPVSLPQDLRQIKRSIESLDIWRT